MYRVKTFAGKVNRAWQLAGGEEEKWKASCILFQHGTMVPRRKRVLFPEVIDIIKSNTKVLNITKGNTYISVRSLRGKKSAYADE